MSPPVAGSGVGVAVAALAPLASVQKANANLPSLVSISSYLLGSMKVPLSLRKPDMQQKGKVQTGVPSPVFSGSSAARRSTIRVARATFRPVRFAPRAVRRTERRAFRIVFRPARRILRATRRPIRRD